MTSRSRTEQTAGISASSPWLLAQGVILPAQDALAAMSCFPDRIALEEDLALRRLLGHCGSQSILVIGAAHAGMRAAQLASFLGHSVAVASAGQRHRPEVEQLPGAAYYNIDGAAGNMAGLLRQRRSSLESSRSTDLT